MTHIIHKKVRELEIQLQELNDKKAVLQEELKNAYAELKKSTSPAIPEVHKLFSPEEKIKIFMNLFRGREDVFPKRWYNAKTGKSGYSPACFNEWIKGKCNKPRIKCSACPNQAFIPLTEEILCKQLRWRRFYG